MTAVNNPEYHKDFFNKNIVVGSVVAYAQSNMLRIGVVNKLTKKMIKINLISGYANHEFTKYPKDTILIDGPEVTMYLLKKQR